IIPLYNKSKYIQRAIDSVLNQTFRDYEIIIINDGTTDGGEKLVEEKYGDKLRLIYQTNQGVSIARNRGIKKAKFPWIAFLDADDYWHPDYLEFVAKLIVLHPENGIIGTHYSSNALESNPTLSYFKLDNYFKRAVRNTMFFTSATAIRKDFFDHNIGFDPEIKLGEDIDVWLRASLYFGDGYYISNTLVYYGQEDDKRATQKKYPLHQTLIPKLSGKDYFSRVKKSSEFSENGFLEFRDKWIYFTLFPHYGLKANKKPIAVVLNNMPNRYLLVRFFYFLPFDLLQRLFRNDFFSGVFRNYMKFCYSFIYT
ncbi:glycosyltransferase family 2 protein, partial [Aquiflexum sp.]|uniref:glycosyltransferase family 2 protein n=1 Tax=Aquiflexum sp. TaxID=1872584 RepID=UPI0035943048